MFWIPVAQIDEALGALIFLVITAIFGVIAYFKKKAAEQDEDKTETSEEADDEIFVRYLTGEEEPEHREEEESFSLAPYERRGVRKRGRKRRPRIRPRVEPREKARPATVPIHHESLSDLPSEHAKHDAPAYGLIVVMAAKKVNLLEALPGRLSPNQKAVVLMEVLGPPKGLTGF